jgi:hypothetical protein
MNRDSYNAIASAWVEVRTGFLGSEERLLGMPQKKGRPMKLKCIMRGAGLVKDGGGKSALFGNADFIDAFSKDIQ